MATQTRCAFGAPALNLPLNWSRAFRLPWMSESRSVGLLTMRRTSPNISSDTAERRRNPHGPGMTCASR